MQASLVARRARLEPLLASARSLREANSPRGQQARERLIRSTGLSAQGVEFALARCLEATPSEAEITALLLATPESNTAHVLLSANVFVAAHRAIAIGLASSANVQVRASRREPEFAELLWSGAPHSFELKAELSPRAGDHLWAYGSDQTLHEVAKALPSGVTLHGHGSGIGLAVLEGEPDAPELTRIVRGLAEDTVLFDQRGCLSPRAVLVRGSAEFSRRFAERLAGELGRLEQQIPRGQLDPTEAAASTAYRDAAAYAGDLFEAGRGFVSYAENGQFQVPPVGRHLHVSCVPELGASLSELSPLITCVAFAGSARTAEQLQNQLPGARFSDFGRMQCPPFDGPVDRRAR